MQFLEEKNSGAYFFFSKSRVPIFLSSGVQTQFPKSLFCKMVTDSLYKNDESEVLPLTVQ